MSTHTTTGQTAAGRAAARDEGVDWRRIEDEAAMWCDLVLGHADAVSAHTQVTRRAELYVRVAGLPLERVYDALNTDAAGWADRLAKLRATERRNRSVHGLPASGDDS